MRPLVLAALAVVVSAGASPAAEKCDALNYAEQETCWPAVLRAQEVRMRKLIETRLARTSVSDIGDPQRHAAWVRAIGTAQGAWTAYRDADCSTIEYELRRHILAGIQSCKAKHNADRIAELQRDIGQ